MFLDYVALDVETASSRTPSICSIGLVEVIGGRVEERIYRLINPETPFHPGNIAVHGITPKMVEGAPIFLEVWEEIRHLFVGKVVVAHNAPFDLTQLTHSLHHLRESPPSFFYLDTLTLARRAFPGLESYSLKRLSTSLALPFFQHHHALADAEAAQALFERVRHVLPLEAHLLRRYSAKRESPPITMGDFLHALEIREALLKLTPGNYLTFSEYNKLRSLLRSRPDEPIALRELHRLLDELLLHEYVFENLSPIQELLWSTFFPSAGYRGISVSLHLLFEALDSGDMPPLDLSPWLRFHTELKSDPLIGPLLKQWEMNPFSPASQEALHAVVFPFDPWESLEGKTVATCGRFFGVSARKFLTSIDESFELAPSFSSHVDVLIVGGTLSSATRTLYEAIALRRHKPQLRIFHQKDKP